MDIGNERFTCSRTAAEVSSAFCYFLESSDNPQETSKSCRGFRVDLTPGYYRVGAQTEERCNTLEMTSPINK